MEVSKAPTLRLKTLNKHTHIMYIEMENVIKNKKERPRHSCLHDTSVNVSSENGPLEMKAP